MGYSQSLCDLLRRNLDVSQQFQLLNKPVVFRGIDDYGSTPPLLGEPKEFLGAAHFCQQVRGVSTELGQGKSLPVGFGFEHALILSERQQLFNLLGTEFSHSALYNSWL